MTEAWDDYASRPRPEPEVAWGLVQRLLEVRRALRRDVEPRPPREREVDRIRVLDDNPPAFCVVERDSTTVTILLTLDPAFSVRPACSSCGGACVHALEAVDELLDWLFDETHERRNEVIEAAGRAPWRRWLDTLDAGLEELESEARRRASTRLWWAVDLERYTIVPFSERPTSRGGFTHPRRVRLDDVENEAHLSDADRAVLASVRLQKAERRTATRDGKERSSFLRALTSLIGHPRVAVGEPGGSPWRVESVDLRFEVDRTEHALELRVKAGDVELLPADLQGYDSSKVLLFPRPEARALHLARIEPQLTQLLERWAKESVPVPAEEQAALMHRLSRASRHLAVKATDLVRELTVEPAMDMVALLTPLPQSGLHIELRVRPLPDGPLFTPGWGPEEVLTSTAERQILRTSRDLTEERRTAYAIFSDLDLSEDPDRPCTAVITELADALETLERLRTEPRLECQWPERTWYPPVTVGTDRLRISVQSKRDWFGLHGDVELDGKRVELAVLIEAARRDRGYVALDEGRFLKLEAALCRRLLELQPYLERRQNNLRLSPGGAELVRALGAEAYSIQAEEAWTSLLDRMDRASQLDPKVPDHLQDVLRPYQREGFEWMSRLAAWGAGAVLADDMGLGKTVQAIAVMCTRAPLGPQMVVAPTSVCFNWGRELARFAPQLEVQFYAGSDRETQLGAAKAGTVFVMSYGVVLRDIERLAGTRWATVVLDEAQAIKNPRAARSRAVRTLDAEWTVALTGTPVENHPSELWAIFEAVFPGLLGSWESFRVRFLASAEREGSAFGTGALAKVVRPYVLRRTKAQVAEHLPPRTEITVDVTLSHRERALYDDARLSAIAELGKREIVEQTHYHLQVFAALTRLRQLACHPRLVDDDSRVPSSKLERLMQLLQDLVAEDRRVLVFSQFTSHLALVRAALDARSLSYAYLDGSMAPVARMQQVDRFQAGEWPVFLISLKAGGTGLNLTAADTVIHLDPWWNPAVEDQATDRAHRLGQTQPVTVMRLVTRDTIEQHMLEMNRDKRQMVTELLDGVQGTGKLTSTELMALIRA